MSGTVYDRLITIGFLMAASLAALPARADLGPIKWDAGGRYEADLRLPGGKFVELCEKLPAGAEVLWAFESAGPTNFNVHYHEGKEVRFPAKQDQVMKADGVLKAAMEQDYCWMWTNKAAAEVGLKVQLKRQ